VSPDVIGHVTGNIINLHISYLPWNRGADPDFWSLIDDTPKGVTIHYMAAALDAGDIIAQKEVVLDDNDTLATYYKKLHVSILGLFRENWASIRNGTCPRIPQGGGGSYHRSVDKNSYIHLLGDGPDTPARKILNAKRYYFRREWWSACQAFSRTAAYPCPTPMHIVARAYFLS
jgi:methionyl-tRNA formyltransferase